MSRLAGVVRVHGESLAMNRSETIAGQIYLEVEGGGFPADGWWDFPVVLLRWWLEGLRGLGAGRGSTAELLFMDGPHVVRLVAAGGQHLEVTLLSRSVEGRRVEWDRVELMSDLRRAATNVLKVCAEREWDTSDVRALRLALGA